MRIRRKFNRIFVIVGYALLGINICRNGFVIGIEKSDRSIVCRRVLERDFACAYFKDNVIALYARLDVVSADDFQIVAVGEIVNGIVTISVRISKSISAAVAAQSYVVITLAATYQDACTFVFNGIVAFARLNRDAGRTVPNMTVARRSFDADDFGIGISERQRTVADFEDKVGVFRRGIAAY